MITANHNPQPRERPSSQPNQLRSVDLIRYGSGISGDMQAGIDLEKHAVEMKPDLRVVYSTALTLTDHTKGLLLPGSVVLEKRYTVDQLITSLRPSRTGVRATDRKRCHKR